MKSIYIITHRYDPTNPTETVVVQQLIRQCLDSGFKESHRLMEDKDIIITYTMEVSSK